QLPLRLPPSSTLFPYTTLFRSLDTIELLAVDERTFACIKIIRTVVWSLNYLDDWKTKLFSKSVVALIVSWHRHDSARAISTKYIDRKSTRLNSSHVKISYAVFC